MSPAKQAAGKNAWRPSLWADRATGQPVLSLGRGDQRKGISPSPDTSKGDQPKISILTEVGDGTFPRGYYEVLEDIQLNDLYNNLRNELGRMTYEVAELGAHAADKGEGRRVRPD